MLRLLARKIGLCTRKVAHRNFYQKPHQIAKQVYFFPNSLKQDFDFRVPYQTIQDIGQLKVRSIKGGFQRRPELIKARQPDVATLGDRGVTKNYGLFDKCERIQQELTTKLLELMNLSGKDGDGQWMLDVGCGHGWSLTIPALQGFSITAVDLDLQALGVIQHKVRSRYLPPDKVHIVRSDLSQGFCLRENFFDCAISVSFLQWLCVGKRSDDLLQRFFSCLKRTLKHGGVAGVQFYPRNIGDVDKVVFHARSCFNGALVSDFPHLDRGRKLFLVLFNGK